ncbi:MAG: LacI family DNA-binding transcriptional regulator, partial [Hylemonella sp.]
MSKTLTRPTIDEVARSAGVSTATVSRVLNKPQTVRDALRKQVMGAISRLGYVPDAGARA